MIGRRAFLAATVGLALLAGGCDGDKGPPIAIEGGGFIFNYRIAEVFYGVSVKPLRRIESGAVLEARFEDPASPGGEPIVVRQPVTGDKLSYALQTPPLRGVKSGIDYKVIVVAMAADGKEIGRVERAFQSQLSQDMLPSRPLTVGPGYEPNIGTNAK